MTDTTTAAVVPFDVAARSDARTAVLGWLAGYKGHTRAGYAIEIRLFAEWLNEAGGMSLFDVRRPHLELYARWCEEHGNKGRGCKRTTVAHKLSVISSFYQWCHYEEILPTNPAGNMRRPKLDYLTTRHSLDAMEARAFIAHAEGSGDSRDAALCVLLLLNGLRISEALNADIEDMSTDRGHATLRIVGKGEKPAVIPLAPRTVRCLLAYTGERTTGPIFVGREGGRMNRHAATRIVRRIAKKAGIKKHVVPHSLRHSFITNALDAGVSLRDVQHSARHSSPATTSHYDHGRENLDRHATHIVTAYLAGAG